MNKWIQFDLDQVASKGMEVVLNSDNYAIKLPKSIYYTPIESGHRKGKSGKCRMDKKSSDYKTLLDWLELNKIDYQSFL
tara:strand:+ start:1607 stop:1843 length:237 start_codon:yes stop_codon:yes gene_type:complete